MVVGTASATLSAIAAIPKATLHWWGKRIIALSQADHFELCPDSANRESPRSTGAPPVYCLR